MIVTCESCKTKFRPDPSRLKGERSKVRCSRCSHVFTVQRPQEEVLLKVDLPEQELNFDEDFVQTPPITGPASLYLNRSKRGLNRRLIGVLGLILVLGIGILLLNRFSHLLSASKPQADKQQASMSTEIRPTVTILDSTQAYFLENVNAGQIFVIEGEVANESPVPVSFILLEGKLYGADNRVAQSQRCFCGNVLKREELTQLSITEIQNSMMNREGRELSNVHLLPGKRVPFMLVFHNLPELDALSDYSIEVISAKTD
jgi:predicted Zn finger-like uncharacterized protein